MIDLLWTLCKYVLFSLVGLLTYLVYTVIVQPYLTRRYYMKYSNVQGPLHVSDHYYPIIGNFIEVIRDIQAGKVFYQHLRDQGNTICKHDLKLDFEGYQYSFKVVSSKAHQEFSELVPHKVDREPDIYGFGKISLNALFQTRTSEDQQQRKRAFMKLLSLNSSSRYIPDFINCLKNIT